MGRQKEAKEQGADRFKEEEQEEEGQEFPTDCFLEREQEGRGEKGAVLKEHTLLLLPTSRQYIHQYPLSQLPNKMLSWSTKCEVNSKETDVSGKVRQSNIQRIL